MNSNKIFIFCILLCMLFLPAYGETPFRVMFYNTENFFDTEHDANKNDREFTPQGARSWTNKRYYAKVNNIAKVITAIGEWDTPVLIGMCEVENDKVMRDLTLSSPLKKMEYRYILTESDDRRGIDVALLYQRDRFKYLYHDCININFPYNRRKKTRDVLHVAGQVITGDTLDVFVCHFPSRRGGELESEPDRIYVASVVRIKVDSLMQSRKNANILIMGDFNDEPLNKSISKTLNAKPVTDKANKNDLYNLFISVQNKNGIGSYKFGRQWNFLDQIIVSGNLLNPNNRFHILPETATIFQKPFLMTEDKSYGGKRPKKSFHGRKYEGGYSDHLPVYADFYIKK
ncbi:MAG: endonuclease [Dysgonamonadaceae bacterium]|nr:endonuclease [Dysgonamonadaceae bacterium]